jgi:proline iminopeptidase
MWDILVFLLPPLILLLLAVVLASSAPATELRVIAVLTLVVLAMAWITAALGTMLVYQSYRLVRRQATETAVSQLRELNPTLTLLHAPAAQLATALVTRALHEGEPLLLLSEGITAKRPDEVGPDGLRVEPLTGGYPVLIARRPQDPPPHVTTQPGRFRGRDVFVILGSSAGVLALVATFVPAQEEAVCGDDCAGFLTTYGDTIYWMANRLLGGDPNGLGVSSVFGRLVGVLITVYGIYVLVAIVSAVVQQRMDDDLRSAADAVTKHEKARGREAIEYPVGEPHDSGVIDVGDDNRLYWETCGNRHGVPAVVLHGGPGHGASRVWTKLLDPATYRLVLFDQRGCGRSTPDVANPTTTLDVNTTDHLIADIERLRLHLGVDRWLVFGAYWGATLGLAYAQRHRQSVSAVVLLSLSGTARSEIDWVARGMRRFLPEEWGRFRDGVPAADRAGDLTDAYARLLTDPDPDVREGAAREWCAWEERYVTAITDPRPDPVYRDPSFRMRVARLETHYRRHSAWLSDDELVDGAVGLAGIHGVLVHGRADLGNPVDFAYRVHREWHGSQLILVDGAGHVVETALTSAVVTATDHLRTILQG